MGVRTRLAAFSLAVLCWLYNCQFCVSWKLVYQVTSEVDNPITGFLTMSTFLLAAHANYASKVTRRLFVCKVQLYLKKKGIKH